MNNSDINAVIAFLFLLVPFGFIWLKAFRHFKRRLATTLSKWLFTLISLAAFMVYYYLMFWTGSTIDGRIGDAMAMASFAAYIFAVFPLTIALAGTLILMLLHFTRNGRP